jgi:hypothetical protein
LESELEQAGMEQLPKVAQQRLRTTANAGVHPDPDLLTAFREMSLKERERAQVLQHLAQCEDCREVVSLAMPEVGIMAPSGIQGESRWLTWPVLRWGALAACVVVVSTAVTLHYHEPRLSVATFENQKPAMPAPVASLTPGSPESNQPAQKLAAKIPPSSPFPSDRAFDSAGKLAKQRDDMQTKSVTGAAVVGGLESGRLQSQPSENGVGGIGPKGSTDLADNQNAKTDALKSLGRDIFGLEKDKPSASLSGQATAPVPSSPPPARSGVVSAEEQARERNENLDSAAKADTETVTVEAEAPVIQTAQATAGSAKDESDKKAKNAEQAGLSGAVRHVQLQSAMNKAALRWTLSSDGALQRSLDSGKTWQTIPVANHVAFRALAANDSDIWVGGAAGALYHSSDAGQRWTQVKPVADGKPLTADIISVEFTDPQNGKVSTSSHETWTTSDGGVTWHQE